MITMDLKKIQNPKYFRLIWCIIGICIFWQLAGAMTRSAFLPRRVRKTLASYKESTKEPPSDQSEAKQVKGPDAEKPKTPKSMFAPPRNMPKLQCTAVLGDQALINDQWVKVGGDLDGAKVVEIDPASVKIRWQEQERTLVPFDVEVKYAKNRPSSNGPSPSKNNQSGGNEQARRPPDMSRPGGGPPDGFGNDERRQMRERYLNASPEERAEMRRQMQERFGGRRGQRGSRPRD